MCVNKTYVSIKSWLSLALAITSLWVLLSGSAQAQINYGVAAPPNANKVVGLLWADTTEFSPSAGQQITIPFITDKEALVSLQLLTADKDSVVTLLDKQQFVAGRHEMRWDGKDAQGEIVPNEAYTPVLSLSYPNGKQFIDDPFRYSGGEIIENLDWLVRGKKHISYKLPGPSRVLIRIGIDEGPLVKSPLRWAPVSAGQSVYRWDGFDEGGVDYVAEREDLWFVVMAYQLPEFSLITTGNSKRDYAQWRKARGWPIKTANLNNVTLQRNGVRLSRNFFLPRNFYPRLSVTMQDVETTSRVGLAVVDDVAKILIDVPAADRWVLDTSFYETGLYIDYVFQSEEEQGFVPMLRQLDVSELAPGRHVATVQLFGFGGFIISDSIEFEKRAP